MIFDFLKILKNNPMLQVETEQVGGAIEYAQLVKKVERVALNACANKNPVHAHVVMGRKAKVCKYFACIRLNCVNVPHQLAYVRTVDSTPLQFVYVNTDSLVVDVFRYVLMKSHRRDVNDSAAGNIYLSVIKGIRKRETALL